EFRRVLFRSSCYGGGFSSIPAYIGDLFGTKQLGAIHGYILTAWAMAGVAGPILLSLIYDSTNSYNVTMFVFGIIFVIAFILSIWIRTDIKRLKILQEKSNQPKTSVTTKVNSSHVSISYAV